MFMKNTFERNLEVEEFVIEKLVGLQIIKEKSLTHLTKIKGDSNIDFEVGGIKYDVKYSNPVKTSNAKKQQVWDFDLRNKTGYCDFLALLGFRYLAPNSLFLIPTSKELPKRHIRISIVGKSKWQKYLVWKK